MSFNLIETLDDLNFLNQELLLKPYVGVDTEFRRTTKDNMRLALIQINDIEEIYLVDTVLIDDPKDSCSFLFSDSVTKIFHSCKEDIEAVYSWTGSKMVNLFDTQLAEAFLNGNYSIGYQGLVEKKIGIIVDKAETRSNWIRRPLTDSQLNYAASDVEFLIELFTEQKQALTESNKLEWHNEELEFLTSQIFLPISYDEDINTGLTKVEEKELLNKFNDIVLHIAELEKINPTMFFSKKSQKDFLRLAINEGFKKASSGITSWRYRLLAEPLGNLLREY
jgi:ribonuclease D